MNLSILKAFFDRLSVRTKLIGMAVIAFLIGTFFGGHGSTESNGRYVPWSTGGSLLDTRTGKTYVLDPDTQRFKSGPSLPYW